jgi:hypothetical protein
MEIPHGLEFKKARCVSKRYNGRWCAHTELSSFPGLLNRIILWAISAP